MVLHFNLSVANAIHELISLEGEHGPLPGHTPAVNDVLSYLEKVNQLQLVLKLSVLFIIIGGGIFCAMAIMLLMLVLTLR